MANHIPPALGGFLATAVTPEDVWRSIILYGENSASYKFALGRTLIELSEADRNEVVPLTELADPFVRHLCEHLAHSDKQGTSPRSRFLAACRARNNGAISQEDLIEQAVRLGFNNVIDAFHVVNQGKTPVRFFVDERNSSTKGIRLTEDLWVLREAFQFQNLPSELEARWRLVETSWALDLPRTTLAVKYDPADELLIVEEGAFRRVDITGCRDALNGYQKGRCFYCRRNTALDAVDIDHFLPHVLAGRGAVANIDGIWNLVLSCRHCNRLEDGKFARVPELRFLDRLHKRNEFLIDSHHPLRETLILQTGCSEPGRRSYLNLAWNEALTSLIHTWAPAWEEAGTF